MKYTYIIWDFNGTILDDIGIGIDSVNVMLKARALPQIESVEKYRKIFGFPIIDYYRRCGFDFQRDDYESVLAPEWVAEYNSREHTAGMCAGVEYALKTFKRLGIKQAIVSASSSDMLKHQTDRLGISDYFENVIGCDNIYAYGKENTLKQYVSTLNEERILMVGDTTHDFEVAKAAGIDCMLLLCGHMNESTLRLTGCELFDDAGALCDYLIKEQQR